MFEQTVDLILSSCKSNSDRVWLLEARHYFCEHTAWSAASVELTTDQRCLLELRALVSPSIDQMGLLKKTMQEICRELVWSDFAAATICTFHEAAVLKFITVSRNSSYTSGRMVIAGEHYNELVRRNENYKHAQLPKLPFKLDFGSFGEQALNADECSVVRCERDWREDALLIPETVALVKRIERCIALGKEHFLGSETSQDALRFNLDALGRTTVQFSVNQTELSNWRKELLEVAHPSVRPWKRDSETIWAMAEQHVSRLLPIIERYKSQHDLAESD